MDTSYVKTESGWQIAETSPSGLVFFMGWDRLATHLGHERPQPEISSSERVVAITPTQHGLQVYVESV